MTSPRLTLTQKYAPLTLSQIYGQPYPVAYFKAVAANPDAASRNYVITGSWGTGKTSLVRAFAADLIGTTDLYNTPNFLELDSYQIQDRDTLLSLKDYIFQEVPGYKVVLLDEWHLVDPSVQAGLLKDIETCSLPIFFFFVSTERTGILDTIFSRSIYFSLTKFSDSQLREYLGLVEAAEGLKLSEDLKSVLVFSAAGHIRDLLNQLELALVLDEGAYVSQASGLLLSVEQLFVSPGRASVDVLIHYPWTVVQSTVSHFLREKLVRDKLLFDPNSIVQIFSFYIKYKRYIQDEHDFFSFLIVFTEMLLTMRRLPCPK